MMIYDEHKRAPIGVFWDVVDCKLPENCSYDSVVDNITKAVRGCGLLGGISIMAYRDRSFKRKPNRPNVKYIVHKGSGFERKKKISRDVSWWKVDHPGISVVMFIYEDVSPDLRFVDQFMKLKKAGNLVLLCQPPTAKGIIFMSAGKAWNWDSLSLGGAPISYDDHLHLVRSVTTFKYYTNMTPDWNYESDDPDWNYKSGDEEEVAAELKKVNLDSSVSPPDYMAEIQWLKSKILEMEKKMKATGGQFGTRSSSRAWKQTNLSLSNSKYLVE